MVIAGAINRISATAALALFFVYAATLGITIGLIVASYTTGSVATAFLSASAMFGAAADLRRTSTKRSLAALGGILFMGVFGLLVAMLVNLFVHSTPITCLISIIGVVLFTALTAYDVQRIQSGDLAARPDRWRRRPSSARCSSTWTSSTCSCSCSACWAVARDDGGGATR